MSNMENLESQLTEKERQARIYDQAVESIQAQQVRRSARGYAVISSAMNYGEGALGDGAFGRISQGAKMFCILFAMLVPSLLVWRVLL
ncbi:hypothetical protein [Roseobacter sp. S98]|uniref:hypothetical protein n=1 Tax=Roseobacter algicola (ex Choi et al. 2025) (nom. illeg.) TaxID=3092138 RepID=UPI0035C742B2